MRLIDADALKAEFFSGGDGLWHPVAIGIEIDIAPTIDAVEVVRCKDCRAYLPPTESRDWGICRRHSTPMRDNNFCNYGEREEHE